MSDQEQPRLPDDIGSSAADVLRALEAKNEVTSNHQQRTMDRMLDGWDRALAQQDAMQLPKLLEKMLADPT